MLAQINKLLEETSFLYSWLVLDAKLLLDLLSQPDM